MPKFFTLLLLILLCTCGRAQNPEPTRMGSGSLVVSFEPEAWIVTVSSASYRAYHYFVTKSQYKAFPQEYKGFTIIPDQDRYNLGMVHYLIDELEDKGWKFLRSNHTIGLSESEFNRSVEEKMYFSFRAPRKKVATPGRDSAEMVLPATLLKNDLVKMRGGILKAPDGQYFLRVEEAVGAQWLEKFKLSGTGLLTEDMVARIKEIKLAGNRIILRIELATGTYKYGFQRMESDYRLTNLDFTSNSECGVKRYILSLKRPSMGNPIGYYRPEPCDMAKSLKPFYGKETLGQIMLKDFMPGSRSVELEKLVTTVYY